MSAQHASKEERRAATQRETLADAAPVATSTRSAHAAGGYDGGASALRPAGAPAPADPAAWRSPALRSMHQRYERGLTPAQKRALRMLDGPRSGKWSNVRWEEAQLGAAERIVGRREIDQSDMSLCGPAALLDAMVDHDPESYARLVVEIHDEGKVKGRHIGKKLRSLRRNPAMPTIDWMVLSGFKYAENELTGFGGVPEDQIRGITTAGEMRAWLPRYLGCDKVKTFSAWFGGDMQAVEKVNDVLATHGDNAVVMMLVNADRLTNRAKGWGIPDHWVRLLEPVDVKPGGISLRAFTWGRNRHFRLPGAEALSGALLEFVVGYLPGDAVA